MIPPPVTMIPLIVEVALVERRVKVEVACVLVATKESATTTPATERRAYGVVVPMPTLPDRSITKSVLEELPTAKLGTPDVVVADATERNAQGVVVPMPTPPANVEVAFVLVDTILPNCPTPPSTNEPWSPVAEERPPAKVLVAVEVLVMVPKVPAPEVSEEKMPDGERKILAKREVEVALRRVVPPFELTRSAVVVAPTDGTASTRKRSMFEALEVASTVRRASGEVVPTPKLPEAVIVPVAVIFAAVRLPVI